ncbi:MAG: hypothetical protein P1U67_11820 [Alcanivoracaceae bacterium]|nr:hypothetical protein [Alcanivoracaceae bacterium]
MEFKKISEQNAWDEVAAATNKVRSGDSMNPALLEWFQRQGVVVDQSVFPGIGLFDDGVFSGTLVTQDRKVVEYFVDMESPDDGDFEDVTGELGPKDPSHPASDVKDLITMSLVYYDAHQSKAA